MNINYELNRLLQYGITKLLIDKEDIYYVANRLLDILHLTTFYEEIIECELYLEDILSNILDYAHQVNIIEVNDASSRDLLDAKIMDCLIPHPSEIIRRFHAEMKIDPTLATDHFYQYCQDINYIRMDRIAKNVHWKSSNSFGTLEISINLSKPEKDPKTIALAKLIPSTGYPKCMLCVQNVGFAGSLNHPARQNHRIIPVMLNQEKFYFQYSPYIYYNEHAIVLMDEHVDMCMTINTFKRLTDFVDLFPGYFLGSNAGLPIIGGSILNHEHYQGGKYHFPIEDASTLACYHSKQFVGVTIELLQWPATTIRIRTSLNESLWNITNHIFQIWESYNDEEANIASKSDKTLHNAITPICRKKDGIYEMDLVLRNNLTTSEYPHGIFHPHPETHHIKKENIGLIEVMGLAILPGRLQEELEEIKDCLINHKELSTSSIHYDWFLHLKQEFDGVMNVDKFIQDEVGKKFLQAITDAGVFKQTDRGIAQFHRFLTQCGFIQIN